MSAAGRKRRTATLALPRAIPLHADGLQAGLWGLLSGSALLIGALVGWFIPLQRRVIAGIMAFGAGVLISALSFELVDEAWKLGGFLAAFGLSRLN
jgi:zinc transporter ZupT